MDEIDVKAKFVDDLIEYVNELFPTTFDCRYFPDSRARSILKENGMKVVNLGHICNSKESSETLYIDHELARSEIVFNFHYQNKEKYSKWIDIIPSFNSKFRLPATPPIHRDVIKWERYKSREDYTGRLKWADESVVKDDLGLWDGVEITIEETCSSILEQHSTRAKVGPLDVSLIQELSRRDWENISQMDERELPSYTSS